MENLKAARILYRLPHNQQSVAGTGDTRVCLRMDVVALCIYAVYCTIIIGMMQSSIALCWTADGVYSLCILIQCLIYIHGK